jgi:Zn-dependent protease with chaperone function
MLLLALILLLTGMTPGGPTSEAETPAPAAAAEADEPVPVPEPSEKALRYYRSGNVLWVIANLWGWLVPLGLLFSGLSARLQRAAQRLARPWPVVLVLYFVLYALLNFVVDLPLSYYLGFARPHAYGLSNQTLAKWAADAGKALLVGLVAGAAMVWIPYLLLRKSPRRWWLWTAAAAVPVMVFFMLIAPVWVDPLFNDFGPMKDKALERRILDLAHRAGIEGGRVFEVEKSVDTETVNAYVTGVFGSKRIVLWDTLVRKLEPEEVLGVMGHEIGHYVLGHVPKGIAAAAVLVLAGLWFVHRAAHGLLRRHAGRFGFARLKEPASLPLILLLLSVAFFLVSPIALAYSRYQEHEADRFELEVTRNNRASAMAFVKLQQENLSNPRPGRLYKFWRASHPPLGERIDFANTYRPWERGEPLRYEEYFAAAPAP